jgi:hypothetical protein
MITGRDLREIAAKMMNIDKHQLEEAGVIKPNAKGGPDWTRFNADPLIFICKLDDDRRDILAALVSPHKTRV